MSDNKPEDTVEVAESGAAFKIGRPLAYQGKLGCRSLVCRRMYSPGSGDMGECRGWHCAVCGEPSSQYGHPDCAPKDE